MTSQAAAEDPVDGALNGVRGLVFFGFPLHPPKQPGTKRAEHLAKVTVPMLFLQGTRDELADLKLLRPVCAKLGPRVSLHIIETADHSFHVLKSSKRSDSYDNPFASACPCPRKVDVMKSSAPSAAQTPTAVASWP